MTTNLSKVVFTDWTRATLDGPDGRRKGWVANGCASSSRLKRIQGGGGTIICMAGIINK